MFDRLDYLARHLPGVLDTRWHDGHWPLVLAGAALLLYVFAALIAGQIWASGNVERAQSAPGFWGAVVTYAVVGGVLALYV
jgi:hypothetical protein